ncbi:MAG: InlB B-repeat-containing protein [Spirochaetota bacterium]|nr:InlB B-repeat-containing protein [Spirochaetota bacterium]
MKCLTIVLIVFALFGFMLGCSSEPKIHQVTFDSNGGSAVQSVNVTDGARIEKPNDPTKPGYSFKGWYRQNTYHQEWNFSTDVVTADLTLYAKWEAETYKVTFNAQGGSPPDPLTKDVVFNQAYGQLAETTRTGYSFIGWTTEPNGQGSIIEASTICMREEDHTLYAKWEALPKYTVTFDPQEGTTPNPLSKDVYYTQAYGQLAETTRTGYSFKGWTTEPNGQGTIINASTICTQEGNHILYAKWEALPKYTVTFDPQEGTTPNPSSKDVYYTQAYGQLAETTKIGYQLIGWTTESNGQGSIIEASTICMREEDHTLYAKWEAKRYTVIFDSQGGTPATPPPKEVTFDEPYGTLPVVTKAGNQFMGWATEEQGGGSSVDASTICKRAEDHTLYAKWKLPFIGEAGGMVFYENPNYETDGWRYLEAAPNGWSGSDTDPKVRFGYYRPQGGDAEKTGANGREIGDGLLNTQILVNKMGEAAYISGHSSVKDTTDQYAARICLILTLSHNGNYFSDWFLPSKEELGKLYRYAGTGYKSADYWSSTEYNAATAYKVSFDGGSHHILSKSDECYVRPIRRY